MAFCAVKRFIMKNTLLLTLAAAAGLNWNPAFGQTNESRVLIIGIDGLRSDCLEAANTPAIDALIADGLFSPDALNNDITYSGPGWPHPIGMGTLTVACVAYRLLALLSLLHHRRAVPLVVGRAM